MIWERVENLPDNANISLVEVLDSFCIGWEMELSVSLTPRKWAAAVVSTAAAESSPEGSQ